MSDQAPVDMELEDVEDPEPASPSSQPGIKLMGINEKAGMSGLDVKSINRTIQEASKGSKFYLHKKVVQEKLDRKVQQLKEQARGYTQAQIQASEKEMTQRAAVLEATRDLSRVIVHLDMDAFFASVEMRDNPALKDVPMAVGSSAMLSTSNYVARRYGVRAAMPGFIAKKLCPALVIVPSNFDKYRKASDEVQEILLKYDPETYMSLDEAQFDLTDCLLQRNFGKSENEMTTPQELVQEIREKICEKTQLTASAGIAPNGFLAKICSDINKPNNQYYLEPALESVKSFIETLPIRKVNGIGAVTEQMLNCLDVKTCGDIWRSRGIINLVFKPATVSFLLRVTLGVGYTFMAKFEMPDSTTSDDRKSLGCERTFSSTSNMQELKDMCLSLCTNVCEDLVEKDMLCKSVCVKIKTEAFDVRTRIKSMGSYTNECDIIYPVAWKVFESLRQEFGAGRLVLRLMGVRVSNLKSIEIPESGKNVGKSKQMRIDSVLRKLIPSRPQAQENEFGKCNLYSTSTVILHILQNSFDDKSEPVLRCPICLATICPSGAAEVDRMQRVIAECHLEKCILSAFEDCDVVFETPPSFQVCEDRTWLQDEIIESSDEEICVISEKRQKISE